MKKHTIKQYLSVMDDMAEDIILWQQNFNKAQSELEFKDGNKRLKVLIQPKKDVVQSFLNKFDRE